MTIDDDCSIYVGGLPYDATEDSIRRIFDVYGNVVAVKIINDRATKGKCYGFVTFASPRAAVDAIDDMDGRTIGGRVVKVNEVRARGGRPYFGRESFRRNFERTRDWDRDRDRERDYDQGRDRFQDRNSDRSRDHDLSQDHEQAQDRGYESSHDHGQARNHLLEREQFQEQQESRKRDRDWGSDHDWEHGDEDYGMDRRTGRDKNADKDKGQQSKKLNGSFTNDQRSRELSSDSSYGQSYRIKEQLEFSMQRHEDLKKEISQMEERLEEKRQLVLDLQKRSQKLEDALVTVKKLSSQHQTRLTKLHKCFLRVKAYSGKIKKSEEELESIVDAVRIDTDIGDDVRLNDGILTNGRA